MCNAPMTKENSSVNLSAERPFAYSSCMPCRLFIHYISDLGQNELY